MTQKSCSRVQRFSILGQRTFKLLTTCLYKKRIFFTKFVTKKAKHAKICISSTAACYVVFFTNYLYLSVYLWKQLTKNKCRTSCSCSDVQNSFHSLYRILFNVQFSQPTGKEITQNMIVVDPSLGVFCFLTYKD